MTWYVIGVDMNALLLPSVYIQSVDQGYMAVFENITNQSVMNAVSVFEILRLKGRIGYLFSDI